MIGVTWCGCLIINSHHQLCLDFQLATGHLGPIHLKKWVDGNTIPFLSLLNHPFRLRVRWFAKMLMECLRHVGQPILSRYGVPTSDVLRFHTGTVVAVPWPAWRISYIDTWILKCLPHGVRRTGTGLDALPIAKRSDEFPSVFISTG